MIANMKSAVVNFLRDEEGASGIEYALIVAMVAVVIVAFVTPVGNAVKGMFEDLVEKLSGSSGTGDTP